MSHLLEISPNVYMIKGFTNVFVIAEETLTVIDTGVRGNEKRILKAIGELGRLPSEIENILITHHHVDHVGAASRLSQLSGAKVCAHKDEVPYINGELQPLLFFHLSDLGICFWPLANMIWPFLTGRAKAGAAGVDVPLEDGQVLPPLGGLKVIHIPGHTPGTECFYSPQRRLLFAGCAVQNWFGRLSLPHFSWDVDKTGESVRKLAKLDFEIMCIAHGPPILHDAAQRIGKLADKVQVIRAGRG